MISSNNDSILQHLRNIRPLAYHSYSVRDCMWPWKVLHFQWDNRNYSPRAVSGSNINFNVTMDKKGIFPAFSAASMRFMFGNTSLQRYSLYFRLTMIENHRSVLTLVQTKFGFNFSFKLAFQETQLSQEKSAICLCAAGCYDVQWCKYGSKSGGHQGKAERPNFGPKPRSP